MQRSKAKNQYLFLNTLFIRNLGLRDWFLTSNAMHNYTQNRNATTRDEVWLVEHPSIFTQGSSTQNNIIIQGNIPIAKSDRGGKITYHGPGQQLMYILIDIKRRKINIRNLINALEQSVLSTIAQYGIKGKTYINAPGVYVNQKKIASLGLRIHKGCSLHGLALNVKMDLSPFLQINPCGYIGMQMTQLSAFKPNIKINDVKLKLISEFAKELKFERIKNIMLTKNNTLSE